MLLIILATTFSFSEAIARDYQQQSKSKPARTDLLDKDQTAAVNEILAKYDSKDVSEKEAKAIMAALKDAKIPPGKGMADAVNNAGFDFDELIELAPAPSRDKKGSNGNRKGPPRR